MKLEEALAKVREGKGYEARLPFRAAGIAQDQKDNDYNSFRLSEILSDQWFVWREPEVISLIIDHSKITDGMYSFTLPKKLNGKKWKAVFTEVIE